MKIAVIVGSIRQESYNLKLAKLLQDRYQKELEIDILDIKKLPFYNPDQENDQIKEVDHFKKQVKEAKAVIWVTPEYNGTIPGVLGNAIDWLSRVDRVMIGKPSWMMGVSPSQLGTARAQLHLRDILFAKGVLSPVFQGHDVQIAGIQSKVDEEGYINDEATLAYLDKVIPLFKKWVEKHN
ncbi:NADPH-dependent FMN reductase [Alkalihalobacillus trypoxylicola]|uniref:NADPH-dependent FMN reductase n=1 Tax=Alkalihalobacillus trypoxylicola TaxID=519424 RepID=A0A161P569_9BACI|nr:NAD(P)H-dependent oxidoreductase [Alkalihalobacillus trypoxylicola]KYG25999.1 NADPH-dependent FMN reductase [Alkalihalobacillus trypoxylicola]